MEGLVILLVVAVVIVLIVATYFSKSARIKRALRNTPRVKIANAADMPFAKLVGRVKLLSDPLVAPLTGRTCAYFEVTVEEYRKRGKSGSWRRIIHETRGQDFLLDDATGVARIDMGAQPDVVAMQDGRFRSGTFNDATPELEAFLQRHGRSSTGWLFNKSIRYREGVLEPGEIVAALGAIKHEIDPDPRAGSVGYRESPRRVVLTRSAEQGFMLSDDKSTTTG